MDDSGIGVGGDSSVMWSVWVNNARRSSIISKPSGGKGYLQGGVDETEPGRQFTISVRVPRTGGDEFARALEAAAKDAYAHAQDPGYRVEFPLVIEPKNEDQVIITWQSAPSTTKAKKKKRKPTAKPAGKVAVQPARKSAAKAPPRKQGARAVAKKKR